MHQVVILAGGYGTRLSEETHLRPKPMVEIGGKPILWHIMKYYASFGCENFVICAGYKASSIKQYFLDYRTLNSDVTFHFSKNEIEYHSEPDENWNVTIVDTGLETQTGGRLRRISHLLDDKFFLTYGDGLSNVDLKKLKDTHEANQNDVTVTAVRPPGRFGALSLEDEQVSGFIEKPMGDGSWINGGYFLCEKRFLDRIEGDQTVLEQSPLAGAARDGKMGAHKHDGFWHPMDTLRDKNMLETLWNDGSAEWKVW